MAGSLWKVIAGGDKGGIMVRTAQDTMSTAYPELLSTGAIIKQVELVKTRLKYTMHHGSGPAEGWVTIKLNGKDLVAPHTEEPKSAAPEAPVPTAGPTGDASTPELIYFDGSGRAELTRLAFYAGDVEFKDTRISGEAWYFMKTDPNSVPGKCFGTIPVIVDGDCLIPQSAATAQYAADLGMNVKKPLTAKQRALDTMMLGARADMMIQMYKGTTIGNPSEKMARVEKKNMGTTLKTNLEGLLRRYDASPGPFLFTSESEGPSLGDLALFDLVTNTNMGLGVLEVDLSPYPKLVECSEAVRRSEVFPKLHAYIQARGF